jgi:hypothetical protein
MHIARFLFPGKFYTSLRINFRLHIGSVCTIYSNSEHMHIYRPVYRIILYSTFFGHDPVCVCVCVCMCVYVYVCMRVCMYVGR